MYITLGPKMAKRRTETRINQMIEVHNNVKKLEKTPACHAMADGNKQAEPRTELCDLNTRTHTPRSVWKKHFLLHWLLSQWKTTLTCNCSLHRIFDSTYCCYPCMRQIRHYATHLLMMCNYYCFTLIYT